MAQLGKLMENLPLTPKPWKLKIGRELNRGAYGVVYEGTLAGQQVAVKGVHQSLLKAEGGEKASHRFCDECERLKKLEHPHVIKFLGAFKDAKLGPILVMEKMNEDLRCFLEKNKDKLTIQEQIRISLEITQGVAFLHQQTPPMVHRDLNDKNVMFTFDGIVQIGDFGQTTFMTEFCLKSTAPGMVSFMAPEALRSGNSKYDESLDVFSLGVLMLSIGTQRPSSSDLTGIGVTPEVQRRAKDLEQMSDCHPLKPFILHCLQDDPEQRPKATQLVIILSRLKENMVQTVLAAEQEFHEMKSSTQAEVASRDAKISELEERCEMLEAQAITYKCDFEKERSDREKAMGRFETERQEFNMQIAELNEKQEAKLSAAKSKMDQMMTSLEKDFQSTLEEKDAKIGALEEEVRDFQRAADQQHSRQEEKLSAAKSKMDQMMTALEKNFQSTLEEKDAKIAALEEEVRDFQRAADQQHSRLVADEEGLTAETSEALNSRSRLSTKEKKQTDQSADVSHEPSSDDLALNEQPATVATKQNGKSKEIWKRLSRDNSKVDLNRYPLKSDFDTIVRNKDNEILQQMEEIQQLKQNYETIESLLSEKCTVNRALEMEIRQLRETYCVPHQDDPSRGHSPIEHIAVHPKYVSSDTAVEKQHHPDQNEVRTMLLEEDGEKDSAELTEVPVQKFASNGEVGHSGED